MRLERDGGNAHMSNGSGLAKLSEIHWGWTIPGVMLGFLAVYMRLPNTAMNAVTYSFGAVLATVLVGMFATLPAVEGALNRFSLSKISRWLIVTLLAYVLISAVLFGWDMANSVVFLLSQLITFAIAIAGLADSRSATK